MSAGDVFESRWKDGGGVIHLMKWFRSTQSRTGWKAVCGAHGHVAFRHPKRCPKPVTCFMCLGLL